MTGSALPVVAFNQNKREEEEQEQEHKRANVSSHRYFSSGNKPKESWQQGHFDEWSLMNLTRQALQTDERVRKKEYFEERLL
jgi:hypothetical protein